MCDDLNTTDIIETECWLCPDRETCRLFSRSYVNRCDWTQVFPQRCDDDNNCDGVCDDGMDYMQAGFSAGCCSCTGWGGCGRSEASSRCCDGTACRSPPTWSAGVPVRPVVYASIPLATSRSCICSRANRAAMLALRR